MLTDPIADYLTRLRNAQRAEHQEVEVPASRLKKEITRILKEQGYIADYEVEPTRVGEVIRIQLRYADGRRPVISGIERVSRPGRRRYVKGDDGARTYSIRDRSGKLHRAYRVVLVENQLEGQYYGIQGTTWRDPPILSDPSATRTVKGRRMLLFRAGSRLRFVAWKTDSAVYWISNTLNLKLSNAEMLALAGSLTEPK